MTNEQFLAMMVFHALLVAGFVEVLKNVWLKLQLAKLFERDPERGDAIYTAAVYVTAFFAAEAIALLNYAANGTGDLLGHFGFSVLHPLVGVVLYGVMLILPERLAHDIFGGISTISEWLKIRTLNALNAAEGVNAHDVR